MSCAFVGTIGTLGQGRTLFYLPEFKLIIRWKNDFVFLAVKKILPFVFFLFLLIQTNCFGGIDKSGSVTGYYNGVVRTRGGSFGIGKLPSHWKREKIKYRAVLFLNEADQASVTIDSWCKGAFDDGPLEGLSEDLLKGMDRHKIIKQQKRMLGGRAALHTEATGVLDGRQVFFSGVVLKKNECVFDFVYVSFPDKGSSYQDYLGMVEGFYFIEGPEVL